MSNPLTWGIIGCGDVVAKKSGPAIMQAGNSRIAGVMRREPQKAEPFTRVHGISLCTDDPKAILHHPEIDIVYVATPPSSHRDYVIAAAAAGKHVLVEKPMGLSAAEDDEMIAACASAGVELFVAYYRRFHPHVLQMKELIAGGHIGEPVFAQIDYSQVPGPNTAWGGGWRVQPEVSGGGLFVDVVSHRIDAMVSLLGAPERVEGLKHSFLPQSVVEDVVALAVGFAGGTLCSISGDFVSKRPADRFMIVGTEGVIDSERLDGHAFTIRTGGREEVLAFDAFPAPHLGLVRHIEQVLRDGAANACSGVDGRWTDWILDRALGRR